MIFYIKNQWLNQFDLIIANPDLASTFFSSYLFYLFSIYCYVLLLLIGFPYSTFPLLLICLIPKKLYEGKINLIK